MHSDLVHRLRNRALTALHTGSLHPGERLQSVRAAAEALDVDPRAVMEAYRVLESERLVEIRPRSGVYLASLDGGLQTSEAELVRWIADEVALGGWQRRVPIKELPQRIARCTASADLLCACVDEVEDERFAICREVGRDFAMRIRNVVPLPGGKAEVDDRATTLSAALVGTDVIVVTVYHEREVRPIADALGIPLVVCTLNAHRVEELLDARAEAGRMTFIVADTRGGDRLKAAYGDDIEIVPVSELTPQGLSQLSGAVVFTEASLDAWGELPEHAIVNHAPLISRETAGRLLRVVIALNLDAAELDAPRGPSPG